MLLTPCTRTKISVGRKEQLRYSSKLGSGEKSRRRPRGSSSGEARRVIEALFGVVSLRCLPPSSQTACPKATSEKGFERFPG